MMHSLSLTQPLIVGRIFHDDVVFVRGAESRPKTPEAEGGPVERRGEPTGLVPPAFGG
jgi:hypothetical protein